ncbi:MAG: amidohydrolase family protein [Eubacteriales bacterium]|nr:amidohydrolase family protein [Eubacteriales bacterium]
MNEKTFALKGTVCYNESPEKLSITENGYLVCENGVCAGVFTNLPEKYNGIPCRDVGDCLIIPGLTDLHLHAPQYSFRSIGMDLELLEWLDTITFPQESKYADLDYARKAYSIFAEDMKKSATTRASIFATLHVAATELLMDLMEETGLKTFIGKVNMDRNGPPALQEESAQASAQATLAWIQETAGRYQNVKPILTPRFTPSCTDELMRMLGEIQKEYHLPVQSHLSENLGEIAWVKELCPNTGFYGEAYDQFGLFGGENGPAIMAHCVHCPDEEIALMKERGVYIAHCSQSNTNLSSGIAPVRRYLSEGLHVGIGSDIAGGTSVSLLRAMADSIQTSKLRWRLVDDTLKPLTLEEVFYIATIGGGSFFGKVGSFEGGYEFDAVILDDSNLPHPQPFTSKERLERLVYLSDDRNITGKYVSGAKIF